MSYIIERLKRKKVNTETVLPPQEDQKKTLVLDLDETLIHTSFREGVYHDF
jgi:TFIIF-interacting CTD phosphatase-like protein